MPRWKSKFDDNWSKESLDHLFSNEIGFLTFRNFASIAECNSIISFLSEKKHIQKYDYEFNEELAPKALHYMTTHYLFENDQDKTHYFSEAKNSNQQYQELCEFSKVDLLEKIDNSFKDIGVEIIQAAEEDLKYSRCMIRSLKEGALLHADFAPFLKEHWSICEIDSELAWNVFLETPEDGGECLVHNRPWQKSDDELILENTYGYDPAIVNGYESEKYRPQKGDFVLFNSRNFHEVLPAKGNRDRITIGGHFGRSNSSPKRLLSWV